MSITNVTMLVFGRPRLVEQALRTLKENTPADAYTLTAFNDSGFMGTGRARNRVIELAEKDHDRGDYLYLSDGDVAFTPGWLNSLVAAYEFAKHQRLSVGAIGGYCHPYHHPIERIPFVCCGIGWGYVGEIGITLALPTQSMLMSWDAWDRYKPFVETPVGRVNCSEDFEFTQRMAKDGLRVAALYPPVVLNTARHDSFGNLAVGHELVKDIDGILIE